MFLSQPISQFLILLHASTTFLLCFFEKNSKVLKLTIFCYYLDEYYKYVNDLNTLINSVRFDFKNAEITSVYRNS